MAAVEEGPDVEEGAEGSDCTCFFFLFFLLNKQLRLISVSYTEIMK